jgi:glycine hydroxymethyltransferase
MLKHIANNMDEEIQYILTKENGRQQDTVELIASENFASEAVMELCGSIFTNKYAEGYPGKRYYNGCENMDLIETMAIDKLCKLYKCSFANVQPHSGVNANTAVYQALMKPGDTLMGMDLASGGHLSHGAPPTLSGKVYNAVTYGVDENGLLNYEQIRSLAKVSRPKVIVAGASAYPRQIDWSAFKDIADGIGAYLVVDMAHYSGLIAGGAYDSPLPYADVVTSTTHKTLRGPRGGMILWNNSDYTKKINSAIFPGTQGGPLMNIIAAKAQCYTEASTPEFQIYAHQIVDNAEAMCEVFKKRGFKIQTDGTDSHIILMDLSESKYSGREAADLLEVNGITVNKNGIPNDPRNFVETSGIRIGTAAETTRGLKEEDFEKIAYKICNLLK